MSGIPGAARDEEEQSTPPQGNTKSQAGDNEPSGATGWVTRLREWVRGLKNRGNPVDLAVGARLAVDLECRSFRLRLFAHMYLVATFALLALAVYIIRDAEDIAAREVTKSVQAAREAAGGPAAQPFDSDFNDVGVNRDTGLAIAVGDAGAIRTSPDGDERWYAPECRMTDSLYAISFSGDGRLAAAAGENGVILTSVDAGKTWITHASTTRKDFNDIALSENGATLVAVGDDGLIRVTVDRGANWRNPGNVTPKDLNQVALSRDGRVIVAVGDDEAIVVSEDGGEIWTSWGGKPDGDSKIDFEAVAFLGEDERAVVVAGDDGTIKVSTDFQSWTDAVGGQRRQDFRAIASGKDGRLMVVVGRNGLIWGSTDEGGSWGPRTSNVADHLEAVALSDSSGVTVAVGRDGTILVSDDGGARRWVSRDSRTANTLNAVVLGADGKRMIVVGGNATILRSESTATEMFPAIERVDVGADPPVCPEGATADVAEDGITADLTEQEVLAEISFFATFVRVATVLILFFMVQYLISLTRYSLRLAAFYDARRDVVLLAAEDQIPQPRSFADLDRMMRAMSPDALDFGRSPRTTVEQAMQMAGLIRGRRRKRGRKDSED